MSSNNKDGKITLDPEYQKPLIQLFTEMIGLNSVKNEEAATIYFHVFMGAYLKAVKITDGISNKDLRTSFCWIQTARTGKGRVNKVFKKICDECGVTCQIITQYTEAGLIGTIDEDAVKFNEKYISEGLCEASPTITVKDKSGADRIIMWRDPVIKGDAGNYDILIFDEMQILLQPKKENQEILLTLQPALDCPPYVRKKLRSKYPIEYSNPVSIIGTTYPFTSIPNIIATSGFLQRMFVYVRRLSMEEVKEMKSSQKDLMRPEVQQQFEKKLKVFKKRLALIPTGQRMLAVESDAREELTKIGTHFIDMIKTRKGGAREALLSFANTVEEMCLKIAGQYAVMHNKTSIKGQDIKRNFELTKKFMENLVNKIEVRDDKDTQEEIRKIIEIFKRSILAKKTDCLSKKEFKEILNKSLNRGIMACSSMIDNYTEAGYFEIKKGNKNVLNYYLSKE